MSRKKRASFILLLLSTRGTSFAQTSSDGGTHFENQYLNIVIAHEWTVGHSQGKKLNLIHGKYLLAIDPVFEHASGVAGGRFSEVVRGMRSVNAVMSNVDQPAGGDECAQWPPDETSINKDLALRNLYTDSSRTSNGCSFPSSRQPVWFGSYFSDAGIESDYAITLAYDSDDVNALPKKGSPELTHILGDVAAMLKTLHFKSPS